MGGAKRYLFDLSSPKHESENLIEQQPEIAKRMAADLVKWAAGLKTPGIHGGKLNPQEEQFYRHYCDAKE